MNNATQLFYLSLLWRLPGTSSTFNPPAFFANLLLMLVCSVVSLNALLVAASWDTQPLLIRVNDSYVWRYDQAKAERNFERWLDERTLAVELEGQTITLKPADSGVSIDLVATLNQTHLEGIDRYLPLVALVRNFHEPAKVILDVDKAELEQTLLPLVMEQFVPAQDARLILDPANNTIQIRPEQKGAQLNAQIARRQIERALVSSWTDRVQIEPEIVWPDIGKTDLQTEAGRARNLYSKQLTLTYKDQTYHISPELARSFGTLASNDTKLVINEAAVRQYLESNLQTVYLQSADTVVTIINSQEASRSTGRPGEALDIELATQQVAAALVSEAATIELPSKVIEPTTRYVREYTKDNDGLAALISDFVNETGGGYYIYVEEIGGTGRRAGYRENQAIIPASNYKAFLGVVALRKIQQGSLSYETETGQGSIGTCIYIMVIHSTNECAIAIQHTIGWEETDRVLHEEMGLYNTTLNNLSDGDKWTTPTDQAKLLRGLHDGTFLEPTHNEFLLGLMRRQPYRSGIPAGSHGAVVADKVGWLDPWTNDMGIVYSPSGDYIIVVDTVGTSWWSIRNVADRVYRYFNP